jgi:hypothetical protein
MTALNKQETEKLVAVLEKEVTVTLAGVVNNMLEYASNSDVVVEAQAKAIAARANLVKGLKQLKETSWKKVSTEVKEVIEASSIKDKVGALGALKTAFEYRILPNTLNADRLRKAATWTSFEGKTVPNTYGKVHTKPGAGQKASVINAAPQPAPVVPTGTKPDASVPTAPAKMVNAKPTEDEKPDVVRETVSHEIAPDLTPFEHWKILFDQFMGHGVTTHYTVGLAKILNIPAPVLAKAIGQAKADLMAKAKTLK